VLAGRVALPRDPSAEGGSNASGARRFAGAHTPTRADTPHLGLKLKRILPIDEAWRRITSQRSLLEISDLKAYSTFIGKAPLGWLLFGCGMVV